jgi:predicted lipid-binding transport protein (Tim44 family)
MANFDLILLALIAVFIFLRLKSVLGSRDGNEDNRNHNDPFSEKPMEDAKPKKADNVFHLPGSEPMDDDDFPLPPKETLKVKEPTGPAARGLTEIMAKDPNFSEETFYEGARWAFEMIITAFAKNDRETLKNLLNPDVNDNFISAIDARLAAGETLENTLVGLKSIEIIEAVLEGKMANITVKIVSEQVNVTTDREGAVVDGDGNYIDTITDIWTFERDLSSKSPNWFLMATEVAH